MYAGNWFNRPRLERGLCEFESRRPDPVISKNLQTRVKQLQSLLQKWYRTR